MSVSSSGSVRKCRNQRIWKRRVAGLPDSVAPRSTLLSSTPGRQAVSGWQRRLGVAHEGWLDPGAEAVCSMQSDGHGGALPAGCIMAL